jgi:hypothetical protein
MEPMARRMVAAGLVTALVTGLAACTADDSQPPGPDQPAAGVALHVASLKAPGIDEETRTRLESEVGDLLGRYIVGGFLGDYPRGDFVRGLADFTDTLADDGGVDLAGLTLAGIDGVASVRATRLSARLSYFDPGGHTVGATAFLDLAFEVTLDDGSTREVMRTGKLVLGRPAHDWQVLGYRLCCTDDGEPVDAEATS